MLLLVLISAGCLDTALNEGKPFAGFDTYIGSGEGRMNGVSGIAITFKFTDTGEPGRDFDSVELAIDTLPTVTGTMDRGNHQALPTTK